MSGHVKTQLIAHDKEVYDIAFSRAGGGRDMFASVGRWRCCFRKLHEFWEHQLAWVFIRRIYYNCVCKNELILNVTSVKTGSLFLFKFVKGCCTGLRRSEMTMGDIT